MSINIIIIIAVLFSHWISDFVAQSDRIAKAKSTSISILTEHVLIYILTFMISLFSIMLLFTSITNAFLTILLFKSIELTGIWFLVNAFLHWIVDFHTSKIVKSCFDNNKIHEAFVVIGFDQFLHISLLFISMIMLNNIQKYQNVEIDNNTNSNPIELQEENHKTHKIYHEPFKVIL